MSDPKYPHVVLLECVSHGELLRQERNLREAHKYFSLKRKSGGGDCGPITRVPGQEEGDHLYSIAFWNPKHKLSILQRGEHVIELSAGRVVFSVRDGLQTPASAPVMASVSQSQDFTSAAQSLQSIPASPPPPTGEVYELQPDVYLLQYLQDCGRARKELDVDLASVACCAQICVKDQRLLVRRLAQAGAAEPRPNWKGEVDKIVATYLCHYEVDQRKAKALIQSCWTSEEVKAYDEVTMAVIVGKRAKVNAVLTGAQESSLTLFGSMSGVGQTVTHWLGEAKLRLLWQEIEHGLGQKCPGVKVTRGEAGKVILEGSVKDICEANDWIGSRESLVSERTISNISPHLLVFLRKVYGRPGMLGNFLGVGNEMEIELRDTALIVFSLCADKLDDLEKALLDQFKEIMMDLPNCSFLSSALQRKLKSKASEMNQGQYRAQLLFASENTVHLLGHSKEVEELSQTVTELILQNTVQLPFAGFEQDIPGLLQQHGVDFSEITFHPFTFSIESMMALEGPSSKVDAVRNVLRSIIDPIFQSSVNADVLASSIQTEENVTVACYSLHDGLQVVVCQGDITKLDADVLVNAANEDLEHCGGVAAALSRAGGPEIQKESYAIVKRFGKIPTGDVVVTTGGNLCCKVVHAVGPIAGAVGGRERLLLERSVGSALNMAERMNMSSIALPCISSGLFGVPVAVCSEAIVTAVKEFGSQGGRSVRKIILIDNRKDVVGALKEACDRIFQETGPRLGTPGDSPSPMEVDTQASAGGATAGPSESCVHVEVVHATIETQQVDALVSPMVGHSPLSTVVGNVLYGAIGSKLTAVFRKEAGDETFPGDAVLVEGLTELPFKAVFLLNLIPWDGDEDGLPVQVLRTGIKQVLTSCQNSGFGSVALPVVGAGKNLKYPNSLVASVLLEEIEEFKESRVSRTPFLIRIVVHPNDAEAIEVFQGFNGDVHQPDQVSTPMRIFLLGKTGSGKSTLANSIFGEDLFSTSPAFKSETTKCQAETRCVGGKSVTLIDTPGFFDTDRHQEDINAELIKGIMECAPGPHAFLIVFKIGRFTQLEQEVITKILETFSDEALKYAVIVFTHGDQVPEGTEIDELINENKYLKDLMWKCRSRYHVFDNKPGKNKEQSKASSKQVEDLLKTIEKMVRDNNGGYYTNEKLQEVREEIRREEALIRQSSVYLSQEQVTRQARTIVSNRLLIQLTGIATGFLVGAFFGAASYLGFDLTAVKTIAGFSKLIRTGKKSLGGKVELVCAGVVVAAGGVTGGFIGHEAAKEANTPMEAAERAASAVLNVGQQLQLK